ncbi:MurR/RpiR family transcriptional regulator [Thalassobacillus pellis]|uniref:MurR/RpiR family transcriptional regulator n=1 Tax=Thalassobacillus pellis TaxID=748008 RepID=UPI001961CA96|nr:MurR/RpiR family transcriptional regulator [Thalassobacillus pellis]MBM7554268.1 DNA-binding MurR/RpiR family transcriptional regulator [Thalassobacillus pellis]
MDFRDRTHKYESKLNDTDDQIIDYIIENKRQVVNTSIQELSRRFYTVPNTITRLSKKLGYDGFSQLKNSLKAELEEEQLGSESTIASNIKRTFELLDQESLSVIARKIRQAEHVFICGVGDTLPFCELLATHLKIGGKNAEFFLHRHDAVYALNHSTQKDLLFLISMSGETEQILEMNELAQSRGITTISLTHFNRNSLQAKADYRFFFYSPRRMRENYNTSDKTPVILAIQVLSDIFWETD